MRVPWTLVLAWNMLQAAVAATDTAMKDLAATSIPSFVLEYAPLVWLHSQDPYMPSDIGQQLVHTTPMVDHKPIQGLQSPLTLDNLDGLNSLGNTSVYLTSREGISASPQPAWFKGTAPDQQGKTNGAVSSTIIIRDHNNGTVDAFYFYFYAYNEGNTVLGMEFGDHVGDWEHNMIRFSNGSPQALWYSQHAGGQAFTYDATEKQGKRPYAYSAKGTHAVYVMVGDHDHTIPHLNLPAGFVVDHTDRGLLWDPVLSAYAYSYDSDSRTFRPYDPSYPVNWLNFNGQWGDDALPGGPELFGQKKYSGGPNGPKFKKLVRDQVCPDNPCIIIPIRVWRTASVEEE
ncbi:hypothetical protein KXW98_005543 [Aspergillus fumigatus]|nr:hypothetical protein CNMCM8714_007154 [Aspergillus fumigatus]KMK60646.1 Putative vacuolar protein sorting-associated protein [Aspergillus fumigatus Z5]KAH1290893.1 hypothetical protein KXX48_007616 [Aspergillus fumigatus]KAH1293119.1 hypothetical protein KXX30_004321 [Aspergillus fumigatus]KAH1300665.1 hypothetical protein KXX11_004970 [Aspergillus fumigatus]